jgi:hypothetical protein
MSKTTPTCDYDKTNRKGNGQLLQRIKKANGDFFF